MKRLLCVMIVSVMTGTASADNWMVSHAAPWAAYSRGTTPWMQSGYAYRGLPVYHSAYQFAPAYGYQTPIGPYYGNSFGLGYRNVGYGFGYGYSYGFNMMANPNVPSYAWGYAPSFSYPSVWSFDGTIPMAGFTTPQLDNELVTTTDSYVERYAEATVLNGSGKLTMTVPADAVVSIQGERMQQTGTTRTFISPALTGPTPYEIKVSRMIDGQSSDQTMSVTMQPNQQSSITVLR